MKNEKVALFNLATVYFFVENKFDESLPLLMKSAMCGFSPSENLLGIMIVYKFGRNDNIHDIRAPREKLFFGEKKTFSDISTLFHNISFLFPNKSVFPNKSKFRKKLF